MLSRRGRAVLEALLPAGADERLPWGLFDAGFEGFLADFRRNAPPQLRLVFPLALWCGAWVAPLLVGRRPPITRLEPAEREAALEALGRSPRYALRQALVLLKLVAGLCYGADPRVRAAVGYPPQHDAAPPAGWD